MNPVDLIRELAEALKGEQPGQLRFDEDYTLALLTRAQAFLAAQPVGGGADGALHEW
jgi:hypothetical protein